ncbi:hypothetical protein JW916_12590 [Candidatus Sumerlaeota bacterium]|nr:hypothetical protein [Candidatus Sumerlaeota bacterium]
MREYSKGETLVANLPYAGMLVIGVAVLLYAYGFSAASLAGAAAYLVYGIVGTLWIMVFVCPYCAYYATRSCPCGYGMIASRIVRRGDGNRFAQKFRRHIPVIVPLWLIPVACGAIVLWRSFSWSLVGLIGTFVIVSYVILPLASRRHACAECPQKVECPWMGEG